MLALACLTIKWRSRSGCSFCFFQRRIEWVGLLENHPEKFAYAKSLEKLAKDHKSPFTWIKNFPLEELEKPESIKKIKDHHEKQLEKLKKQKSKAMTITHFVKGKMWRSKRTYLWTMFQVHA